MKPIGTPENAAWLRTLAAIAIALAAIFALHAETLRSMVATWTGSEAFAHGLLIVPISLYLAWRSRREVAALAPRPDYLGFVMLAAASFVWLLAAAGQVLVLQQYAVVAMLVAAVLAIAGRRVSFALAFPLMFLFFAVPVGDALVPQLMNWTADFTVAALRMSGMPVYREGNFFAIPSGRWSVVEACSGLRYLLASITVGTFFAYVNFKRWWKRAIVIVLALVVPVLANFLRAYTLVMVGHFSNMTWGVNVWDHFLLGWLLFGAVIAVFFWIASMWREDFAVAAAARPSLPGHAVSARAATAAAAGIIVLAAVAPAYARQFEASSSALLVLAAPKATAGWISGDESMTPWRPRYVGAAASRFQVYRKGEHAVALYIGYYRNQRQGAEVISFDNLIAPPDDSWTNIGKAGLTRQLTTVALEVKETRLRSAGQQLLVWDWIRVAEVDSSNPYRVKALLARDKLIGKGDDAAAIIVATPYSVRAEEAAQVLEQFAREMLPSVGAALAAVRPADEQ